MKLNIFKRKKNAPPKSKAREWRDAIVFAVVAATFIRWIFMEAFVIPTPSMESSLLVGDFLFVSKIHYGARTPKTPLQVPLTHQKIWGTNIPSYVDWLDLPQYRIPGFSDVERNDVVVFNYPGEHQSDTRKLDRDLANDGYPIDLRTNYIKRCVAVPGDVLTIKDMVVHIGESTGNAPELMEQTYVVQAKSRLKPRTLKRNGISPSKIVGQGGNENNYLYTISLTAAQAKSLEAFPFITQVNLRNKSDNVLRYNHIINAEKFGWTSDNFGPLQVPGKGWTIPINEETIAKYGQTIKIYDHNNNVEVKPNEILIDGKAITEYTFKQNYYFMMGDNRDNSEDSRYWGFVPEDHVVGKAFMIWMSFDNEGSWFSLIRWKRLFNLIE